MGIIPQLHICTHSRDMRVSSRAVAWTGLDKRGIAGPQSCGHGPNDGMAASGSLLRDRHVQTALNCASHARNRSRRAPPQTRLWISMNYHRTSYACRITAYLLIQAHLSSISGESIHTPEHMRQSAFVAAEQILTLLNFAVSALMVELKLAALKSNELW